MDVLIPIAEYGRFNEIMSFVVWIQVEWFSVRQEHDLALSLRGMNPNGLPPNVVVPS